MFGYQEKLKAYQKTKKKPQYEETKQTSEPDMTRMLELSSRELKAIMINKLWGLVDKQDIMQEQIGSVSTEIDINKEPKRNANNQKHCNRNERKGFDKLISRMNMAEEITSGLENRCINRTFKNKTK